MKNTNNPYLIKYISIILIAVAIAGCVKEYAVPGTKYNDMVVIDGLLTDQGEAVVRMTHSYDASTKKIRRGTGAEVTIADSDGQIFVLEDKSDEGMYRYISGQIPAKVGKSYQLRVKYDGVTYISSAEQMLAVPEITGVSFAYSEDNDGVWVNASMSGDNDGARHFAWAYDETWKFRTPYATKRLLDNQICYSSNTSKGILTATTESQTVNRFENSQVYFIGFDNDRLAMRYSTMLKLQSISRDTYKYLEHTKKLNVNNGSLFDPIPSSVNGNISSEDGTVAALGNFQVSAESHRRFYIDYQDLKPGQQIIWGSDKCLMINTAREELIDSLLGMCWVIMDSSTSLGVSVVNYKSCFDCMSTGAPNVPPSWWEERPSMVK